MPDRPPNAFLRSLGQASYDALAPHLVRVELPHGQVIYRPDDRVDQVYFPEDALISILTTTAEGQSVETAMSGNEGGVGLLEACGSGVFTTTCLVQVDGVVWRAPAAVLRSLALGDEEFGRKVWTLVEFQMTESRQSGMCQAIHSVEPRLARWLVESYERADGRNPMPLTQEFIGAMLGVQRTTVTAFAGQLQKAGLIQYQRGRVEITDLAGLEARACECRQAIRDQRRRLRLDAAPAGVAERRV
ncbi:MAG TPA: Crp/Fnr family transcriptional regulator [Caulobacteraceae bacterium]